MFRMTDVVLCCAYNISIFVQLWVVKPTQIQMIKIILAYRSCDNHVRKKEDTKVKFFRLGDALFSGARKCLQSSDAKHVISQSLTQMIKITIDCSNLRNSFIYSTKMMQFRADFRDGTTDVVASAIDNYLVIKNADSKNMLTRNLALGVSFHINSLTPFKPIGQYFLCLLYLEYILPLKRKISLACHLGNVW
jgi:hypothetical protein